MRALVKLIEVFAHSLSAGDPYDIAIRFRRFDGVYRWFQARGMPFRDSNGRILRWYVLLTDIDDLKRAEEELRRSQAFLLEGQRLARIGNFVWQLGTGDISWSEQVYRMFEFEPGTRVTLELIGSRVHPEDLPMLYDMVERAQRGESYFEYEHRLVMPDNSVKHLHLVAHAVRSDQDGLEYIGAVQDVTRRRLAEEALDKARSELAHVARVATVSTLTASIAHEINQPLGDHHERGHVPSNAGRKPSEHRRGARNREAHLARWQSSFGRHHAFARTVQQKGVHPRAAGHERRHAGGRRALAERPSEKPDRASVGVRRRTSDDHRRSHPTPASDPESSPQRLRRDGDRA